MTDIKVRRKFFFCFEMKLRFRSRFSRFENFTFTHVHIAFTWGARTIFVETQNRWAGVTRALGTINYFMIIAVQCRRIDLRTCLVCITFSDSGFFSSSFHLLYVSDGLSFRLNAYMWTNEIYSKNGFMQHVIRRECVCRVKMNANKLGATCFCICPLSTAIVVDGHICYALCTALHSRFSSV